MDYPCIQPTYEELKLCNVTLHGTLEACIQPTYEELKLAKFWEEEKLQAVSSLPMRN